MFIGVLGKDGATNDKEIEGASNISSRLVKGSSLIKLDYKGREDLQSS